MNDLLAFCKEIAHESNSGGVIEGASCNAIKFDDSDGFVKSLNTNYSNKCRVDYFEIIENGLILIELKDIKSKALNMKNNDGKSDNNIRKEILANLESKFIDSLGILKNHININLIPLTNYLVITNNTETVFLDRYLSQALRNKPFVVCKTNDICNKLSHFNTKICQE